jgi:hypothetical protein
MRRDLVRGLTLLGATAAYVVWLGWGLADLPNREGSKLVATVLGAVMLGIGTVTFAVYGIRSLRRFALVRRLRTEGAVGEARVLHARPTRRRNGRPYVMAALDLQVVVPGEPPFDATVEESVAVASLGAMAGTTLPVLVDRNDRRTVAVDWEAFESGRGLAARASAR